MGVAADVVCLDAGVWIKAITSEELTEHAIRLVADSLSGGRLVAPAFCWAEVGSVLRKKVRLQQLTAEGASDAWADFQAMTVAFLDTAQIRTRAWELAARFEQSTLYDTAYLACVELAEGHSRTYWTADDGLLRALGRDRPSYVRHLRELAV
ncbi:MAG: type II toxin-antitoxin system VapC family toxin [Candidatus Dormibacteraeota bacterium]|nr:type II toxin-antitoxin system VapC family toxin [Candidatus Dormibacteraeota bacterium]